MWGGGGDDASKDFLTNFGGHAEGGGDDATKDFLTNFGGHAELSQVVLVHIQEIIVDVGITFDENDPWTLVGGKKAGEWRGTAIAFRSNYNHTATTIHHRACFVVISDGKHTWGSSVDTCDP